MSKAKPNDTTTAPACPVLPLIAEHLQVERNFNDADEIDFESPKPHGAGLEQALKDAHDLALEQQEILRFHASIVQARCAAGALFQLGVLNHLADDLADMVSADTDLLREETRRLKAAVLRLSHSIGVVLADLCDDQQVRDAGGYYLPAYAHPLAALDLARKEAEALARKAA